MSSLTNASKILQDAVDQVTAFDGTTRESLVDTLLSGVDHLLPTSRSSGNPITVPADLKTGQVIDRYGSSGGTFTSPLENGEKLTYDTRGLPYPESYQPHHQYEVVKDITKENVLDGFNKLSETNKQLLLNDMEDYKFTFDDIAKLRSGEIAEVFGQGGGPK